MEKIRWWENKPGQASSMRIAMMIGVVCSTILFSVAMFLSIWIMVDQLWEAINMVNMFLVTGGGIIGTGEIAKSIQSRGGN